MQIGALPCWAIKPGQSARPKAIKTLERSMTLPFVIYRYVRGALLSTRAFWKISVSRPRAGYRGAPVFSSTLEAHRVNGVAVIQNFFNSLAASPYLSSVGQVLT